MGRSQRQKPSRRKKSGLARIATWAIGLLVIGAAGYGLSQVSGIAFDEDDIRVVNFQGLTETQRTDALEAANRARCTCGCGLGLAQCVATDPNCPIRESNIERIRGMVRESMIATPE